MPSMPLFYKPRRMFVWDDLFYAHNNTPWLNSLLLFTYLVKQHTDLATSIN